MANFARGEFKPRNPQKYMGKYPIRYLSSWENSMMRVLDMHESVLLWSSESVSIPYLNPLTKKYTMYIPDLIVVYMDRTGKKHCEMIEIKPYKETLNERAKSKRGRLVQVINAAKWSAAMGYCKKHGWDFRVLTERELFAYKRK